METHARLGSVQSKHLVQSVRVKCQPPAPDTEFCEGMNLVYIRLPAAHGAWHTVGVQKEMHCLKAASAASVPQAEGPASRFVKGREGLQGAFPHTPPVVTPPQKAASAHRALLRPPSGCSAMDSPLRHPVPLQSCMPIPGSYIHDTNPEISLLVRIEAVPSTSRTRPESRQLGPLWP